VILAGKTNEFQRRWEHEADIQGIVFDTTDYWAGVAAYAEVLLYEPSITASLEGLTLARPSWAAGLLIRITQFPSGKA
jgi:hypothetical protein